MTQLSIERKTLDRIIIEIFKIIINVTLNSDRIIKENPLIDHVQIIEDRTNLIIKSLLHEIDIQAPKERKIIKPNKHLVSSTEITICKRKKRRAEEKLTLIKKRGVRGRYANRCSGVFCSVLLQDIKNSLMTGLRTIL